MFRNQTTKLYVIACNITSEPMKQPHGTLNQMNTIIKCTSPDKYELKKHCKPNLMEWQLVTPFDME